MDNPVSSNSILDTLRTVEFRLGLKGYNVDEVDEYLEKAALEAEQVQVRLRAADERMRQAAERVAQLEVELQRSSEQRPIANSTPGELSASDGTSVAASEGAAEEGVARMLALAQRFVDQTKRESETEAAEIVRRAEEHARTMVSQAEERVRQMSTEAEHRLRDDVAKLEALRVKLAADVESLSKSFEQQRVKIRASLTEALEWVDERVQPLPSSDAHDRRGAGEPGSRIVHPAERTAQAGNVAPRGPAAPPGSDAATRPAGERPQSQAQLLEQAEAPVAASLGARPGGPAEASPGETNGSEANRRPE